MAASRKKGHGKEGVQVPFSQDRFGRTKLMLSVGGEGATVHVCGEVPRRPGSRAGREPWVLEHLLRSNSRLPGFEI